MRRLGEDLELVWQSEEEPDATFPLTGKPGGTSRAATRYAHVRPAPIAAPISTFTAPVQRRPASGPDPFDHHAMCHGEGVQARGGAVSGPDPVGVAVAGVRGANESLPFANIIQAAFGRHDLSDVRTSSGAEARDASASLGAAAYATGNRIAFAGQPDLHTAAHEAAHVIQQRSGVSLSGGVGKAGDAYEQHADRVADRVVAGQSAEPLLDEMTSGSAAVQRIRADAGVVQRTPDEAAPEPFEYTVQEGELPHHIAEKFHVSEQALKDLNRDKLQKWEFIRGGCCQEGFNAGEVILIPAEKEGQDAPDSDSERTWGETFWDGVDWIREKRDQAKDRRDAIAGKLMDGVNAAWDWWNGSDQEPANDQEPATPEPTGSEARPPSGPALPAERMQHWVDTAASCYEDKKSQGKMKQAHNVEQIDAWLAELAPDMAATTDPVQLRVLASVKFQLETTKRGTRYQIGSERDHDIDKTFDCAEALQWMLIEAGLGELFGEAAPTGIATEAIFWAIEFLYGGALRQTPKDGDIMMWGGHTAMVADVRPDESLFYVSHIGGGGSYFNAFDLADHTQVDYERGINIPSTEWSGGFKGFWAPEDKPLPAPVGMATTKRNEGRAPKKLLNPAEGATGNHEIGERVELLKPKDDKWLIRPVGSKGVLWMPAEYLEIDE